MWGFVRSSRTLSVSSRSSTLPLRRVSAPRAPHFCPSPRLSHPSSSYFYSSSSASAAVESNNNNNNSHSRFTTKMSGTAQKIDGKVLSDKIRNDIKAHVAAKQQQNPEYKPSLVIIQVGNLTDSTTYVRMKKKAAEETSLACQVEQLDESTTEAELLSRLATLNADPSVHGILVQLPLPYHMSEHTITSAVSPLKDVDGFGTENIGELAKRDGRPLFVPCTPKGIMALLETTPAATPLAGKHAVVIGRSNIVGRPVSYLLQSADATVTLCHSKTVDLPSIVKLADIVVVAIGVPEFVHGSWLKPGAVVVDVGMNYVDDPSRKAGYRLVGDVHFQSASEVASHITPVPGGVGPMTVTMLMQNVVEAADRAYASSD